MISLFIEQFFPRVLNMQLDPCGRIQPSKLLFPELKKTLSGHSCDNITRWGSCAFELFFWNPKFKYPLYSGHLGLRQLCWQKTRRFPVIPQLLALESGNCLCHHNWVLSFQQIYFSNKGCHLPVGNERLIACSSHKNRRMIWDFEILTTEGDRTIK